MEDIKTSISGIKWRASRITRICVLVIDHYIKYAPANESLSKFCNLQASIDYLVAIISDIIQCCELSHLLSEAGIDGSYLIPRLVTLLGWETRKLCQQIDVTKTAANIFMTKGSDCANTRNRTCIELIESLSNFVTSNREIQWACTL